MKKIRNTQLMLRTLPFALTIMLLMSCDSQTQISLVIKIIRVIYMLILL